jgi:ureidoglycolate lyase
MSVTEVASYNVRPEPLSPSAFAAFGDVAERPIDSRRRYLPTFVVRSDEATNFSIWISSGAPIGVLPLKLTTLERHPYSAQTFMPLGSGRYLAIVCSAAPDGGPDLAALRCFIAGAHQSITYARNVWHHPMTVLDNTMEFVVAMGMTGRRDDDVFVSLNVGVDVVMPQTS